MMFFIENAIEAAPSVECTPDIGILGMALGGWPAGRIFDSTGGYTPAFLVGAAFNVTNLIIVVGLIRRTRAGGAAPMRPVAA